ncbi:hypothetical protein D018_2225B, partial [Vibrio parahaemolyticus VP2007-007]
IQY